MTQALVLSALLVLGGTASHRPATGNRLQVAQSQFNEGDFAAALKTLQAAEAETSDDVTLARIGLLEGQAYGAQRDFASAEQAFARALEHDATISLDPSKVDPDVVKILESVRERLHGQVHVVVDRPGARVFLDRKSLGLAPVTANASVGRHSVEVRSADGRVVTHEEIIVEAGRQTDASIVLPEAPPEPPRPQVNCTEETSGPVLLGFGKPMADLKVELDPFELAEGAAIEIGGGLEAQYVRITLQARVFPIFGLTAKVALTVPVVDRVRAYLALEIPLLVPNPTPNSGDSAIAFGLGGVGGVEFLATKWFSPYVELGARHFFIAPQLYDPNRLTLAAGIRLRLP